MVSLAQKSRGCSLLILSLAPSFLPPLPLSLLPTLTISLWPVLSLPVLRTPKVVTSPSVSALNQTPPAFTAPAILTLPTSANTSSYISLTAVKPISVPAAHFPFKSNTSTSLFIKTSPTVLLISSSTAATKTVSPHRGKVSSLCTNPVLCCLKCHPALRRPKQHLVLSNSLRNTHQKPVIPNLHRLLPFPHTCLTVSTAMPVDKNISIPLSKMSQSPVASKTVHLHPPNCTNTPLPVAHQTFSSISPPPTSSTSPPASHRLPFPALASSSPSISKSSPHHLAKTSPVPFPATSPPPPETTTSHQPRFPPPQSLPHTAAPLFEDQPFIVSWNIPNLVCNRYNISLDTSPFKGVATPAKVPGQFLSLFYTDRLGLYPHVDHTGRKMFYGGIPQRGNLRASMNKAQADIHYYIPSRTTRGLAVIDWEEWRPLWDRNWGTKRMYQTLSVAHAMQTERKALTAPQAIVKAKQQFQVAARSFMSDTLALGRSMRPNYLWGFYLFPNCYNYGWHERHYTGRCSREVRRQNDELLWLWESSTALYPSVYLQASLADSHKAALMVRNRVQEALRVSALPRRSCTAPVFVYTRPVFTDQNRRFLSQVDLVSTIGESAAVGASGAVLWGASSDYDDKASCEALSSYLSSTLNPYVANVTAATQLCGNFLCRGNGRCIRKNYNSDHYLHLSTGNFQVTRVQNRYLVRGRPTFADLKTLSQRFTCQCYEGLSCTPRTYRELAKALIFNVKQGLYKKAHELKKAAGDHAQQASIAKENAKKKMKV